MKKLMYFVIALVIIIGSVFIIFYDPPPPGGLEKKEADHEVSGVVAADLMVNDLNASIDDMDFGDWEEDDSTATDTLVEAPL